MKTAWPLAHSTPAFTGLLTLSFTLSSRSLTRGGLCLTSAQSWISVYVEEQASSFHLIHPHTAKGKSSASQKRRLLPLLTPPPTLTPHPPFPHSAQRAAFPSFCNYRRAVELASRFLFQLSHGCQAATPWLPETLSSSPTPVHPLQDRKPPPHLPGVLGSPSEGWVAFLLCHSWFSPCVRLLPLPPSCFLPGRGEHHFFDVCFLVTPSPSFPLASLNCE